MTPLLLHECHQSWNASFGTVNGCEVVEHYGDVLAEHTAARATAALFDLGCRSRLCVTGSDRQRFLNGQVTNNVRNLAPGRGCYAALTNAKGRLESDLFIHCLAEELLLDFEPGFGPAVSQRLERYLVADDVQIVDVSQGYGLLTVLGPQSRRVLETLSLGAPLPLEPLSSATAKAAAGEFVVVHHDRGTVAGFDLFVPAAALSPTAEALRSAAREAGGRAGGWQALELIRLEAGLPRFGVDMDASNLAPEAGIDARAISPDKGCYIGQEIINRLRTFAHVNRLLCGLRLLDQGSAQRGDKLFLGGKEVGHITSAAASPAFGCIIALGYVRREASSPGQELAVHTAAGDSRAVIVPLPFPPAG